MIDAPHHFKGKDALGHIVETQAKGLLLSAEVHGIESPGHLTAADDAARETAVILCLAALLLGFGNFSTQTILSLLFIIAVSLLLWKAGRSAWLGWYRLERLHRLLEQERFEIEHHRQHEKEELRILYEAKGFEGKLLDEVIDVLMADNDRLLKIMVEEELGLSVACYEHPLKQGIGAACGVFVSSILCLLGFFFLPRFGIFIGGFISIALAAAHTARLAQNDVIPAVVWNLGIAILSISAAYFLLQIFTFQN